MKRMIALLLTLVMILGVLTACGGGTKTTKCELCGKEAKCRSLSFDGETGWFCDDCYDGMKALVDLAKAVG